MPNWCEGSLKLRGKSDNILKFFKEGVNVYRHVFESGEWTTKQLEHDACFAIYHEEQSEDGEGYYEINLLEDELYIEETNRAFILNRTNDYLYIPDGDFSITYCNVQQAWDFRTEDWLNIARKYNLDLKLYGIEYGCGFVREIEIVNGKVLLDESNNYGSYENFKWNCPFPWIGG